MATPDRSPITRDLLTGLLTEAGLAGSDLTTTVDVTMRLFESPDTARAIAVLRRAGYIA